MLLLHETRMERRKTEHLKWQQDYDPVLDWKEISGERSEPLVVVKVVSSRNCLCYFHNSKKKSFVHSLPTTKTRTDDFFIRVKLILFFCKAKLERKVFITLQTRQTKKNVILFFLI